MKLIVMGTGPFAAPMFEALYAAGHEILLLVTRPAKPLHGKTQAEVNPMRELALARGTPIFEPESINTPEAQAELAQHQPELFVVCDYGQILKPATLAVARLGGVNLHASLLPKYRGAAPINWAIYHGETETGVTVIHMSPQVDAGPAIKQERTPIGPEETTGELEPRLAKLGAPLVVQAVAELAAGTARPIVQDAAQASRAPRLRKEDGAIDWSRTAAQIKSQIRALQPWPKSFTFWRRSTGAPLRLILDRVEVILPEQALTGTAGEAPASGQAETEAGVVLVAGGDQLVIRCGQDALRLLAVQPAGKRSMKPDEFLRGYALRAGDRLGPEN